MVLDAGPHHDLGAGQDVVHIAPHSGREIRIHLVELARRVRCERGFHVDRSRELVVVDDHELGRVNSSDARLGDNGRDRIADEAHLVVRERRPRGTRG